MHFYSVSSVNCIKLTGWFFIELDILLEAFQFVSNKITG